jgi:hypothetical protein
MPAHVDKKSGFDLANTPPVPINRHQSSAQEHKRFTAMNAKYWKSKVLEDLKSVRACPIYMYAIPREMNPSFVTLLSQTVHGEPQQL